MIRQLKILQDYVRHKMAYNLSYYARSINFCHIYILILFLRNGVFSLSIDMITPTEPMIEDHNATLTCIVTGSRPAASITWFNGSNLMPLAADGEEITEEQGEGYFTTRSNFSFLAAKHDHGVRMRCRGRNAVMISKGMESLEASLELDIYYKPRVILEPKGTLIKNYGESLVLNCDYDANPTTLTKAVWLRDGKEIDNSSTTAYEGSNLMNISKIRHSDKGLYSCKLSNVVGTGTSTTTLMLEVFYGPVVRLIMSTSLVLEEENSNVTMECEVISANPNTVDMFKWIHNEETKLEGRDKIFSLTEVDRFDTGNYTCVAHSTFGWGENSEPKELIVHYLPSPAHIHYYPSIVIKGMAFTLTCNVPDLGHPPASEYSWYHNHRKLEDEVNSQVIISGIPIKLPLNYSCNGVNDIGFGPMAHITIPIMAPPTFLKSLPFVTGVLETNKNVSLTCHVECKPQCVLHWLKDGHWINKTNAHYVITEEHVAENPERNVLDSIRSTLIWNFNDWPNNSLTRKIDDANYTCVSSENLVGTGIQSNTIFKVEYSPENIQLPFDDVNITEGDVLGSVLCHADAEPKGVYVWTFQNEVVSNSPALDFDFGISKEQSGLYTCTVNNRHGSISSNITINVVYKPECQISIESRPDGKVAIHCRLTANPEDVAIEWKLNNTTFTDDVVIDGLLSSVTFEENEKRYGMYECLGTNAIGVSEPCSTHFTSNKH